MRRIWGIVLAFVVAVAIGAGYFLGRHEAPASTPPAAASPAPAASAPPPQPEASPWGSPEVQAQVKKVVEGVERSGHPPRGIAQGGRRGSAKGAFLNTEGKLPAQPRGYYIETDVWPRGAAGRGPQRLVFGKGGEVYYSPDHYKTFVRVQ